MGIHRTFERAKTFFVRLAPTQAKTTDAVERAKTWITQLEATKYSVRTCRRAKEWTEGLELGRYKPVQKAAALWRFVREADRRHVTAGAFAALVALVAAPALLATVGSGSPSDNTAVAAKHQAAPKPVQQPVAAPVPEPQSGGSAPAAQDVETQEAAPSPAAQPVSYPDNLDGWIAEAIDIMQANGVPVSESDAGAIKTIALKESSGNPNAINLWDSNAAAGIPSKGLMQTIDPTFNAYMLPGHGDIYNPVDNIIAGVRYTISRYGGFSGHPGLASMASGGAYQGY